MNLLRCLQFVICGFIIILIISCSYEKNDLGNFEKAIAVDSTNVKAYREIAQYYILNGQLDKALSYIDKGLYYNTKNHDDLYVKKITTLLELKRYEEIIDYLDTQLEYYNEKIFSIKFSNTISLYKSGDLYKLIKFTTSEIEKRDNRLSFFLFIRGLAYLEINEYKKAIRDFTKRSNLVEVTNRKLKFYVEMMLAYILMENNDQAKMCYSKINMTKVELLKYSVFLDHLQVYNYYNPIYKKLLIDFIEAQPE